MADNNLTTSHFDTSNDFNLIAAAAPVLLAPLKESIVSAGNLLELIATINAAAEPVEAVWQKDNKPVDTNAKGVTSTCENGRCTLKIDSCWSADAGEYSVTVKNPAGNVTSSAKITVIGLPVCHSFTYHECFQKSL